MNFISTQDAQEAVSFQGAVIKGLAKNKALFVPEYIPVLETSFFDTIEEKSNEAIAFEVMKPFIGDSIDEGSLRKIVAETIAFPLPVVQVENNIYALELFHGPTQAFKDVGARFMSRCLSYFSKNRENVTILVATSGDTGSAVANGFHNVEGVEVVILFPDGKVSPYQEYQMTSLGENIQAFAVKGVFDDCQALVKQAFSDEELNKSMNLSSANSINIARLLPQMLYYFFAYKQMKNKNKPLVVSVPSGNFGNLTAGIIAKKMGLPIERFIAATNENDTFTNYWEEGIYKPKASVSTYSNAMDVGAPSNFERLMHIYDSNLKDLRKDIQSKSVSDQKTLEEIQKAHQKTGYVLDPHGAVGKICLDYFLNEGELGIFLETAHPKKFESVVQRAIPDYPTQEVDLSDYKRKAIDNSYGDLLAILKKKTHLKCKIRSKNMLKHL